MEERNPALIFLTSNEAADLLRISRRTLERMRVDGSGPRHIKVGAGKRSRVLYRETEIDAWLTKFSSVIYALDECICWPYGDPARDDKHRKAELLLDRMEART